MSINFKKVATLVRNVKVGDKLWIGTYNEPKEYIGEVMRLTPTQVVVFIDGRYERCYERRYERRFHINQGIHFRPAGTQVGDSGMFSRYITGYATPEEIQAVNAEKKAEERRRKAADRAEKRRQAKITKLDNYFSGTTLIHVTESYYMNSKSKAKYTIANLTEAQVMAIADLLNKGVK